MAIRGEAEFLNLPFQEKLEFLYGLPARQKRDLIISAPEAERLVQSFSPETLFYTVKEIGVSDAGDLLSMAVPEQIKALFDLDCWRKDRADLGRMGEWIEAMAEGGRRLMADALMELDLELVTLLLRKYLKVHRLDEAQAALEVLSRQVMQFDEHYVVEVVRRDNILPLIQEFLEEIFERDYDYFASLMEEIYWGADAELEEEAYQFRRTRLEDQGFPDYFDAQSVFAYLNPQKFCEIRAGYVAPSREDLLSEDAMSPPDMALIEPGADHSLLNVALTAGFAAQGKRQLRSEMAMVTNQVLVARAIDFGDLDAVRTAVELTHHYLNLGLEHLAGGDLASAIKHLRDTHLKLLFRLGVSLTIDLRKRAEALLARLGLAHGKGAREVSYLDSPYREALAGFAQTMPQFYTGLDGKGAVTMRDFGQMRDLHVAYALLEQIEAMRELLGALLAIDIGSPGFRAEVAGRDIRLSQILLTALVQKAMSGRLRPEPIDAGRLPEVRSILMGGAGRPARLTEEFRDLVPQTLSAKLEQATLERAGNFVSSCLNMIEEEFSDLEPEIDPRYIRSLLLRRG
jgi:hypothetical protein